MSSDTLNRMQETNVEDIAGEIAESHLSELTTLIEAIETSLRETKNTNVHSEETMNVLMLFQEIQRLSSSLDYHPLATLIQNCSNNVMGFRFEDKSPSPDSITYLRDMVGKLRMTFYMCVYGIQSQRNEMEKQNTLEDVSMKVLERNLSHEFCNIPEQS